MSPLDVIKIRFQVQGHHLSADEKPYRSIASAFSRIAKEEGIQVRHSSSSRSPSLESLRVLFCTGVLQRQSHGSADGGPVLRRLILRISALHEVDPSPCCFCVCNANCCTALNLVVWCCSASDRRWRTDRSLAQAQIIIRTRWRVVRRVLCDDHHLSVGSVSHSPRG